MCVAVCSAASPASSWLNEMLMGDLDRLDPDLRAAFAALVGHDFSNIAKAREVALARRAGWARSDDRPMPPVTISELTVPSAVHRPPISVRRVAPHHPSDTALIWIHGGGHVMGMANQDDAFLSQVVDSVRCTAFSVEVRLAPEFPYPAALEDAMATLAWVRENARALGVRADLVAVGGVSAGGGIAAGLTLRARDERVPLPCFQLLVCPMLDDRSHESPVGFNLSGTGAWSPESNRYAWSEYLRDAGEEVPIYAAPGRAASLAGVSESAIFVGDLDLFRDEAIAYGRHLLLAGIPTDVRVYRGAFHGFNNVAPTAPISMRFNRDICETLEGAFVRARAEQTRVTGGRAQPSEALETGDHALSSYVGHQ